MPGYANPEDRAARRGTRHRSKARKRSRPDHGTHYGGKYQAAKRQWKDTLAELGATPCHQVPCLQPGRPVFHGEDWDLAHDVTGTVILGPSHPRCNRSEAARRGNRMRSPRPTQWPARQAPAVPEW